MTSVKRRGAGVLQRWARRAWVRTVLDRGRPLYHRVDPWTGLNGLDRKLVGYLPPGPGVFVEAGANDGIKQSNTYYLERKRNWSGVLVEPVPELAARCVRNRPGSKVAAVALVPPELHGQNVEIVDVDLMSVVHGSRSVGDEAEHVAAGELVQGVRRRTLSVPGRTLSSVLDEMRIEQVDLLSLDLEGYEVQALYGLEGRHRPSFVLVETQDVEAVADALGDAYRRVGLLSHHDWLFQLIATPGTAGPAAHDS
jgi:FkbM family methyltransferase